MDIEAIVNKFAGGFLGIDGRSARNILRAALTELAAGYEKKIAGLESEAILSRALSERIRQLEAELAESRERIRQLEAERVPEGWVHSCAALCTDGIKLWIDACPHCGMPRNAAAPAKEGE